MKNIELKPLSNEAQVLVDNGFKGNGCGSGFLSHAICGVAQMFVGVDLSRVWLNHDAEYSLSRSVKTLTRKNMADSDAEYNINALLCVPLTYSKGSKIPARAKFARLVHTVLVLGGSDAYWDVKTSDSYWKLIIVGFIIAIILSKITGH